MLAEMSGHSVASLKIGTFVWFLRGILNTYCFRDCQSAAAVSDLAGTYAADISVSLPMSMAMQQ